MMEQTEVSKMPESLKESLNPVLDVWVDRMQVLVNEIKMSPTEDYLVRESIRTIDETMAILISQGAMECPQTMVCMPAHRFFSELGEDKLLERRMRTMGCEFDGKFPDWISEGILSYLDGLNTGFGVPRPYKKNMERRKRILEASKDALLTVVLDCSLGGGVTIPIRFRRNRASIEHTRGICVNDHVNDISRELTSDERDLLLDLVILMRIGYTQDIRYVIDKMPDYSKYLDDEFLKCADLTVWYNRKWKMAIIRCTILSPAAHSVMVTKNLVSSP